jgi:hypothetical protein
MCGMVHGWNGMGATKMIRRFFGIADYVTAVVAVWLLFLAVICAVIYGMLALWIMIMTGP